MFENVIGQNILPSEIQAGLIHWQTVVGLTGLAQRVGTRVRHDTAFWRQLAWRKDV